MATDPTFLLGEYGARLSALEASVTKIDQNVEYLVQRETVRDTKEKQTKVVIASAGGFLGAIFAFVASILKDWLVR
ncbi:MAG: hypothetical protein K0S14_30 [Thermomicrobiales bacterium]|jgi:hypothetical protein|nr:hypothetical protein [Thermomicrobiales bacterium]